jgi:hypothetical protein
VARTSDDGSTTVDWRDSYKARARQPFSLPIAYSFNQAGDQSARALFLTSIDGKTTRKLAMISSKSNDVRSRIR